MALQNSLCLEPVYAQPSSNWFTGFHMKQFSPFSSLILSVSHKRKILGFPGLLLLQRNVGALSQLLSG